MVVLIVLLVSWAVLRGIGAAGVNALASWQYAVSSAMGFAAQSLCIVPLCSTRSVVRTVNPVQSYGRGSV